MHITCCVCRRTSFGSCFVLLRCKFSPKSHLDKARIWPRHCRAGAGLCPQMDSSALSLIANLVSWIQRMQERVQKEYDDSEWHPLDRIVWWHKYDMRILSEWPFDAVQVYEDANTFYALGSLKAACSLDIFLDRFGQAVDVVVSCCAEELRAMPGGPSDWQVYFPKGSKCCYGH